VRPPAGPCIRSNPYERCGKAAAATALSASGIGERRVVQDCDLLAVMTTCRAIGCSRGAELYHRRIRATRGSRLPPAPVGSPNAVGTRRGRADRPFRDQPAASQTAARASVRKLIDQNLIRHRKRLRAPGAVPGRCPAAPRLPAGTRGWASIRSLGTSGGPVSGPADATSRLLDSRCGPARRFAVRFGLDDSAVRFGLDELPSSDLRSVIARTAGRAPSRCVSGWPRQGFRDAPDNSWSRTRAAV
jgi:hypothetical protein